MNRKPPLVAPRREYPAPTPAAGSRQPTLCCANPPAAQRPDGGAARPETLGEDDWRRMRNRPLSRAERHRVREFYRGRYHERSDYTRHHPWHVEIAEFRVRMVRAVFQNTGVVLDAGCAAGEVVAAFRRHRLGAVGFDVCPDLPRIAYPEVRAHLRIGDFDRIPFERGDGIRTLVSYDVLEHVPIDVVERIPDELERLGITQIACVIANDTLSPGHITVQDTAWWVGLFERAGFRLLSELDDALADVPVPASWNDTTQQAVYCRYTDTGVPRNGWNQVPGCLFLERR